MPRTDTKYSTRIFVTRYAPDAKKRSISIHRRSSGKFQKIMLIRTYLNRWKSPLGQAGKIVKAVETFYVQ